MDCTWIILVWIVVGIFGTVPKGLQERLGELEIRVRIDIIQTTAQLKSARILVRVFWIWEDLSLSDSCKWWNNINNNNNGGARGVMVIVVGHGHGDTSSNPGRGW